MTYYHMSGYRVDVVFIVIVTDVMIQGYLAYKKHPTPPGLP